MTVGKLAARYAKELRSAFGLWPAWLPDNRVEIGDYGRLDHGVFIRAGNLRDVGVATPTKRARTVADHAFASERAVATMLGPATDGSAVARVTFGRGFGVYVALTACAERGVTSLADLAGDVVRLKQDGHWDPRWCLVTGVLEARSALIAVSSRGSASFEVALPESSAGQFGKIVGGAKIVRESGLDFRTSLAAGCTPLFRLGSLLDEATLMLRGGRASSPRIVELDAREGLAAR